MAAAVFAWITFTIEPQSPKGFSVPQRNQIAQTAHSLSQTHDKRKNITEKYAKYNYIGWWNTEIQFSNWNAIFGVNNFTACPISSIFPFWIYSRWVHYINVIWVISCGIFSFYHILQHVSSLNSKCVHQNSKKSSNKSGWWHLFLK